MKNLFGEEETKTLAIFVRDSYVKYKNLYKDYVFDSDNPEMLKVYSRDPTSGEESLVAAFRKWDYFTISSD
jgi:hypothetical protein